MRVSARPLRTGLGVLIALFGAVIAAEDRPLAELIDEQIAHGYAARNVMPAELCTDHEFLRRVMIDLVGTIPSLDQLRAFVADPAADKRAKLIDRLLAGAEHARHMQHVFDVMLLERQYANYVTEAEWREYLRTSFLANKPWDQLVREIVGTDGVDPATRPALRFALVRTEDSYRRLNPPALTRDIGRLLLGVNLQCAQCHDHPSIADYKQADYYGLLAFVSRSHVATIKQDDKTVFVLGESAEGAVSFTSVFDASKAVHVTTPHMPGAPQIEEPAFEKGKEYAVVASDGVKAVPAYSRREQLAKLLPAAENRPFARNIVNRLWDHMLGRGLVHPVEVHHAGNPPSHPQLLETLTDRIIDGGFNLRETLRGIALSRTYQLSSTPPAGLATPSRPEAFAVAAPRAMRPETYAFALMQATGFTDAARKQLGDKLTEETLYKDLSGALPNFAKVFGGPPGQAESVYQASLDQALFLEHGPQVLPWLNRQPNNLLDRLAVLTDPTQIADELYLSALSRPPTPEEAADVAELCANTEDRPNALQDLLWALIASSEFRFNH